MPSVHLRPLGTLLLTIGSLLFVARSARADFADDAVSIVEQVIEDDVATDVVPHAAKHFPVTCDLLPASITAMQSKRYDGFSTVVRQDLADSLGMVATLAVDGGDLAK